MIKWISLNYHLRVCVSVSQDLYLNVAFLLSAPLPVCSPPPGLMLQDAGASRAPQFSQCGHQQEAGGSENRAISPLPMGLGHTFSSHFIPSKAPAPSWKPIKGSGDIAFSLSLLSLQLLVTFCSHQALSCFVILYLVSRIFCHQCDPIPCTEFPLLKTPEFFSAFLVRLQLT